MIFVDKIKYLFIVTEPFSIGVLELIYMYIFKSFISKSLINGDTQCLHWRLGDEALESIQCLIWENKLNSNLEAACYMYIQT